MSESIIYPAPWKARVEDLPLNEEARRQSDAIKEAASKRCLPYSTKVLSLSQLLAHCDDYKTTGLNLVNMNYASREVYRRSLEGDWVSVYRPSFNGGEKKLIALYAVISQACTALAQRRIWEKERTVWDFNKTLLKHLLDTDEDTQIPTEALRRLPYSNPLVVFREAVEVVTADLAKGWVRSIYITGCHRGLWPSSTEDPESTGYGVAVLTDILNEDESGVMETELTVMRLNPEGKYFTVRSLVDSTAKYFNAAFAMTDESVYNEIRQLIKLTVCILLYAVSSRADSRKKEAFRKTAKSKRVQKVQTQVVEYGYRIGAELDKELGNNSHSGSVTDPESKRRVVAHIRRAHWHTYRVGPGRRDSKLLWIAPTLVGSGELVTTVHRTARRAR